MSPIRGFYTCENISLMPPPTSFTHIHKAQNSPIVTIEKKIEKVKSLSNTKPVLYELKELQGKT